jgi:hypothetical protein
MDGNSNGGSATTVLTTIIIILIIAGAFWFGMRSNWWRGDSAPENGVNVDVTLPTGSGQEGGPAE